MDLFDLSAENVPNFILSLLLDNKLKWSAYLEAVVSESIMSLRQVRPAVSRTWGIAPSILYRSYTAVIRPRIQFGEVV